MSNESAQPRLRLMYSSNAFWCPSGYGTQGLELLPRLAELEVFGGEPGSERGRDNIGCHFWFGMQGGKRDIEGFQCYPAMHDPYGNDIVGAHVKHFGANFLISLIDVWVLKDIPKKIHPALFCPWLPIDHDPVPDRVLHSLQGAHLPITYSKWGRDQLARVGVENHYVPHGINPRVFYVMQSEQERVAALKEKITRHKNGHLTLMVSANKGYPDRKSFQVQLRAWAMFAKNKPYAHLHIHTEPLPSLGGLNLPALVRSLGIADKVSFPDRYENSMGYEQDRLALLYNCADVLLGASMSEGFGIPLIEAQACGVPVVTTNFSAMPELVRFGHAVDPQDPFWTPMDSWQAWPDARGIAAALEDLHEQWYSNNGSWPMSARLKASSAIHDEFDWDTIVRDQWTPLLNRLADEAPRLSPNRSYPGMPPSNFGNEQDVKGFIEDVNKGAAKMKRVGPLLPHEVGDE